MSLWLLQEAGIYTDDYKTINKTVVAEYWDSLRGQKRRGRDVKDRIMAIGRKYDSH